VSADPNDSEERVVRFHIPVYDDLLKVAEVWLVLLLLFLVLGATFLNILDRNFGLSLWDYAVVEKMVYSLTFYLGLFGGVIAARQAKHISIDAVSHFLKPRVRSGLRSVLQIIGAATCFTIAYAAYLWIYTEVGETDALLATRTEWWLNTRLWRWPIVIAFALMALHFLVNAGRFAYDTLDPPPEAEPMPFCEPDPDPAPEPGDAA